MISISGRGITCAPSLSPYAACLAAGTVRRATLTSAFDERVARRLGEGEGGGRDGEGGRVRDRGLGGERIGIKEEGRGLMGLGGRAMDGGWGVAYSARGSTMS